MSGSETRAWKLLLRSPLHVSEQGVGLEETLEYIPSDSLFSALVVTWLELEKHSAEVPGLLAKMKNETPLLLTSAFPFAGDVLFLPKPNLPIAPFSTTTSGQSGSVQTKAADNAKKYKKVRWVSLSIFERLVNAIDAESLRQLWLEDHSDEIKVQGGTVWISKAEKEELRTIVELDDENVLTLWSAQNTPKVTIDRIANASALFHVGRMHFAPGCGLWLMATGESEWVERTQDALQTLADSGIGGQRSRGNGQFCLQKLDALPLAKQMQLSAPTSDYDLLLSRCTPRSEQMSLLRRADANYQLVVVGGFSGTPGDKPLVRQQVRMLSEGSIIGHSDDTIGKLVNVNPLWDEEQQQFKTGVDRNNRNLPLIEHSIYRNGFAFRLPIYLHPAEEEV